MSILHPDFGTQAVLACTSQAAHARAVRRHLVRHSEKRRLCEWAAGATAGVLVVRLAGGARRQSTRRAATNKSRDVSVAHVPNSHLVHGTWYDHVGMLEPERTHSMPPSQPAVHLLQAHRDSFKYFLQHSFGFELKKMAPKVKLTEDSIVLISQPEAEVRGIKHSASSRSAVGELSGTELSKVLPATFHNQRFSGELLTDRIYYVQGTESADVAEMKGDTYFATAFVPMIVTDCETGLAITVQVKIGRFPMLTEFVNLIIGGNPYIIAHRLERSSGAYFSVQAVDEAPMHVVELVTEEYSRIRCRCFKAKDIDQLSLEILMPKSRIPLPACLVLLALGLKPEQIKRARNAGRIWTEEYNELECDPDRDACTLAAAKLCSILDIDADMRFGGDSLAAFNFKSSWSFSSRVGPLGRRRLNERLGLELSDDHLTPKDFLATTDLLVDSFLGRVSLQVDDIDSLVNKRLRSVGQKMQGLVRDWLGQVQQKAECLPIKVDVVQGTGVVSVGRYQVRELDKFCVAQLWKENNRQLFEAVNPLAELTQARRVTQVSELGLDKIKRIQGIRLIHPSHYGRICPIETGEGMSAGIVMSMSSNTRATSDGELEAPHQLVSNGVLHLSQPWEYLLARSQFGCRVAQFDIAHAADGTLLAPARPERGGQPVDQAPPEMWKRPESVTMTHLGKFGSCSPLQVEYVACGTPISVAVGLIPFVEHDDANRALMGAKHQQQAVPLMWPERPVVGSGMEAQVATYSGRTHFSGVDGHVLYSDAAKVITISCKSISRVSEQMRTLRERLCDLYLTSEQLSECTQFENFLELCRRLPYEQLQQLYTDMSAVWPEKKSQKQRLDNWLLRVGIKASLQSLSLPQSPEECSLPPGWIETELCIHTQMVHHVTTDCAPTKKHTLVHDTVTVRPNDAVCSGDIVSEGAGISGGELALGKNLVVAYMPYNGYNYEDAIVISDRCVREDILTSVHIEELSLELEEGYVLAASEDPRDEGCSTYMPNGLAVEGTWLRSGDPAIMAISTQCEDEELSTPGDETFRRPKPKVIRAPPDVEGRVIDSSIRITEKLEFGETKKVKVATVLIAVRCRIQVGDKLSGRHGNKGIVARIVPIQDMPYLPDGTPIDVCLNPLGVPSRMNVGQIFENILGSAGRWNGEEYRVGSFDEMFAEEASRGFEPGVTCKRTKNA